MAEVNVEKSQKSKSLERPTGRGLARRGEDSWESPFWGGSDLFTHSPFAAMRRFAEHMERTFGSGQSRFGEEGVWSPAIDVSQSGGQLKVHAELPGLTKDDVKLEIDDDSLVIRGERKREHEEQQGGYRRSERFYGTFYRRLPLPEGANTEQARAQFNNGVLEITVPVPAERSRSREVPIEAGPQDRKQVESETADQKRQSKAG